MQENDIKKWYAFYTKPKHEFKAEESLKLKEVEYYLPTIKILKQWSDRKKKVTEPVFKSYIFVKVNEKERIKALQAEGVVSTISFGGKPSVIPDWEIDNLRKMLELSDDILITDEIVLGTTVRVTQGPFEGIEGVVVEQENNQRMLGISINLLQRSVLVKCSKENILEVTDYNNKVKK